MVRPGLPPPGSNEQKRFCFRINQSEADGGEASYVIREKGHVVWMESQCQSSIIHTTTATWLFDAVVFCICRLFFRDYKIPDTHINCIKGRKKKRQDRREKRQRKNALINSGYNQRYGRHNKWIWGSNITILFVQARCSNIHHEG